MMFMMMIMKTTTRQSVMMRFRQWVYASGATPHYIPARAPNSISLKMIMMMVMMMMIIMMRMTVLMVMVIMITTMTVVMMTTTRQRRFILLYSCTRFKLNLT